MKTLCDSDDAPADLCGGIVGMLLGGDAEMGATTLIGLLGGADSLVTEDGAEGDCGSDCNAISVCLLAEGTAATISGISAE